MDQQLRGVLAALICAALAAGCTLTPEEAGSTLPALPSRQAGSSATATPALPAAAGLVELPTAAPLGAVSSQAAGATSTSLGPNVIARVNGHDIPRADYEEQVGRAQVHFAQQPGFDAAGDAGRQALQRFRQSYLEVMIDQVLIQEKADALGIVIDEATLDAEYARVRGDDAAAFEGWLSGSNLTREALRDQLRTELVTRAVRDAVTSEAPRTQPQLRVSHILVATQAAGEAALARLRAGESLSEVARDLSEDAVTRDQGGDLGYLPRGVMPPAFDDAAFGLALGEPSGIIETEAGVHILVVTEPAAERPVPDRYWPAVQQYAFDQWLSAQRDAAAIERADVSRSG